MGANTNRRGSVLLTATMSYKCISEPERIKCETGNPCNYCNIITHLNHLEVDLANTIDQLDKVYTLLLLQSKSIQTTFKD